MVFDGVVDESGGDPQRHRDRRRGLGPFTSGHLTVIVVTLVVMVGFPFAAFAVTGNNVFVTDATSGVHAKVNSLGQLKTSAVVSGAVTAPAAAPSDLVALFPTQVFGDDCAFYTPPAGKAVVITKVDVYPQFFTSGNSTVNWEISTSTGVNSANGCTPNRPFSYGQLDVGDPPHVIDLGAGIALANGHYLNAGTVNGEVMLDIYGYYVPASACSSGCFG